jgi:hypothetical protein
MPTRLTYPQFPASLLGNLRQSNYTCNLSVSPSRYSYTSPCPAPSKYYGLNPPDIPMAPFLKQYGKNKKLTFMKNTIKGMGSKMFLLSLGLLFNVYAFAQDAGSTTTESNATVNHTASSTTTAPAAAPGWLSNPIVWVAGGAVLLVLILIAVLSRNNSNKSQISRSTTTTTRIEAD